MKLTIFKETILDKGISGKALIMKGSKEWCLEQIKGNNFVKVILEEK